MDLGKAKLLRTGVNALHQAIHPVHGIAWTDGKQVCLTSFCCARGEARFGDSNVIGQFEHVFGLSWGPPGGPGSPALLAVQHKKHVTVWQLQLSALEENKLLCTQTCEMSEPFPLLSQGCVWHPRLDVLAVLSKRDVYVLFAVRVDNRRVKADIRGNGLVHCACWTKDGGRLVVAVGSTLQSFIWNDVQKSLVACSFCPIFDVGGSICAIQPTGEAQVAVATELPLDKICGLNAGMAFELPAEAEHLRARGSHSLASDDDSSLDSRRRSFESDRSSGMSPGPGPVDLTHLLERHRHSEPGPLISLQRRDNVTGSGQDSSHLILVTYERKVTTTRKVNIPGILVPDIIAFDPPGSTMAVASNSCNMVLVYCITASSMPNVQQISLQKNERPKGICFLNKKTLLVVVGRLRSTDSTFLQSSNTDKYMLRIMVKELSDGGDAALAQNASHGRVDTTSPDVGIRRHSDHRLPKDDGESLGIKDLVLPGGGVVRSPGSSRRRLVEHLSDPPSPVAAGSADFSKHTSEQQRSNMDHGGRVAGYAMSGRDSSGRDSSSRSSSPRCEPSSRHRAAEGDKTSAANERSLEQLIHSMERLFTRCAEVQQCLTEMREYTQNGRKPPQQSAYPSASEATYVYITCQRPLSENVFIDDRRPVLLCEGKLCLRAVQDLFDLTIVEMMYGPLWVVLVADADGFVPLTFKTKEELMVRNGKRKPSLRGPGSPENSCPPSPMGTATTPTRTATSPTRTATSPTRSTTSPNVNKVPTSTSPEQST